MKITPEILLEQKTALEEQISKSWAAYQQAVGAKAMIDVMLGYLAEPEPAIDLNERKKSA